MVKWPWKPPGQRWSTVYVTVASTCVGVGEADAERALPAASPGPAVAAAPGRPIVRQPALGTPVLRRPIPGRPLARGQVPGRPLAGRQVFGRPLVGGPVPGRPAVGRITHGQGLTSVRQTISTA